MSKLIDKDHKALLKFVTVNEEKGILAGSIKKYISSMRDFLQFLAQSMIDKDQVKSYDNGQPKQRAVRLLSEFQRDSTKKLTRTDFCSVRDYLIVEIELSNAHRAHRSCYSTALRAGPQNRVFRNFKNSETKSCKTVFL